MTHRLALALMIVTTLIVSGQPAAGQESEVPVAIRNSVVKITTTYRAPDILRPWTRHPPADMVGTGVVIDGERILTNAHVVEYATRIQIQPANSTRRYIAEIEALASGIDLAVIRLRDGSDAEAFFAAHPPLQILDEIPSAGQNIEVFGFPIGGEQLSITKGVVSRIDYSMYYNLSQGLMIQVDAAINPGNSGGPAVNDGKMIGLVFSQMRQAENIGFIIPAEEIQAFLADIEDGSYSGRSRILFRYNRLEADQLRSFLGLDDSVTGVYITDTAKSESFGELQDWDVVTHIGEYDIDNNATVEIRDDLRLEFQYLAPHVVDEDGFVTLRVWRAGEEVQVKVPTYKRLPLSLPFLSSEYPPYFIYGPLCFMPAYADFLGESNVLLLTARGSPIARRIFDEADFPDQRFVSVLSPMFTHPITEGYDPLDLPTLRAVNGIEIRDLDHLVETLRDCTDEWIIFDWHDKDQEKLIFRRADIDAVTEEILDEYGIRRQMSEELEAIWLQR